MTSRRDLEKLFGQWNPNGIKTGDRVVVSIGIKYLARVVGLVLDEKNKKVFANLKLFDNTKKNPIRVDVADCQPARSIYVGHHDNS